MRCENGYLRCNKRTSSCRQTFFEFFKGTLPNHYFTSQNHVSGGLDVFRCGTKCGAKTGTLGAINARVRAVKLFLNFSKEHFQTTTLRPKTMFEVVWMYFVAALNAVRKRVS